MEFLHFLEGLRNPVFDFLFSIITLLGEETLFMAIGLTFFWCVSKSHGYYLLCTGFVGTAINQFLKMIVRVPRPWVLDPEFTIVESARFTFFVRIVFETFQTFVKAVPDCKVATCIFIE